VHWVADELKLGSLSKGSGKGSKKRMFIGHFSLAEEQFTAGL